MTSDKWIQSLRDELNLLSSDRPYHYRRVPSVANLTTPNSPFTSRPHSRKASADSDEDEEFSPLTSPQDVEGDIYDEDDGIVIFSNRDVDEVANSTRNLAI